jgi:hypothetical protein
LPANYKKRNENSISEEYLGCKKAVKKLSNQEL